MLIRNINSYSKNSRKLVTVVKNRGVTLATSSHSHREQWESMKLETIIISFTREKFEIQPCHFLAV